MAMRAFCPEVPRAQMQRGDAAATTLPRDDCIRAWYQLCWPSVGLLQGFALGLLGVAAAAQAPDAGGVPPGGHPATFQSDVNMVVAPVVVRDSKGRAAGGLRQEDFRIFDKGKPQTITYFAVETRTGSSAAPAAASAPREAGRPATPPPAATEPIRSVAYLFDDLHLKADDLMRTREAARRHFNALPENARVALFTTSGLNMIDFTSDRAKLDAGLLRLMPRSMEESSGLECPSLSLYEADIILNQHDSQATDAAIQEVMICTNMPSPQRRGQTAAPNSQQAQDLLRIVQSAARRVLVAGSRQSQIAMSVLRDVVKHMGTAPGRRSILLASPGFLTPDQNAGKNEILNLAIRSEVVINSLDARGLYVDPGLDASKRAPNAAILQAKIAFANRAARAQANVLAEMAYGSGGDFFQNNNDLDAGFRKLAELPEYVYLLGFTPQKIKADDSYHALKVEVNGYHGGDIQARKGYYDARRPAQR
jgi:VWFA-related protein